MFFESNYGKVYYEVYGKEGAPAVLFCHGINMSHETFKAQAEGLKEKYRVIIWDMPYHGMSDPIDKRLSFSYATADIISGLLEHLNIQKVVLVGLSLGSYVTQIATHKYPEKVKATIHIGGGPLYPSYTPFLKVLNPLIALFIRLYPSKKIFKSFAEHRALKADTKAHMERVASENGKVVLSHLTQELIRDMTRGLPQHTNEPKLLCYGDHEVAMVRKMMERWHQECTNSRLVVINEAHHVANQDNPDETNSVIMDFLESI